MEWLVWLHEAEGKFTCTDFVCDGFLSDCFIVQRLVKFISQCATNKFSISFIIIIIIDDDDDDDDDGDDDYYFPTTLLPRRRCGRTSQFCKPSLLTPTSFHFFHRQ